MLTHHWTNRAPVPNDAAIYRILDANANRAREALRVAEEAVRFVLERPDLAEALKRLRHDLRAALAQLDARRMLLARDAAGDIGTTISTESERRRTDAPDVARAAFKRLTEALRAIEEYGKTIDADMAAAVEKLRYRAYDLEKRFEEAARPATKLAAGGLCVLLTQSLCRRPWGDVLRAILAGGAAAVQAHDAGALMIVNDRPDIAVLAAADGVHVGQDDLAPHEARRLVGPDRIVGVSTHSLAQARAAAEAGADYIGCGPMFQSTTKPQAVVPGPALAVAVTREVGLPVMAIGGITAETAPDVLAAGARWLAVSSVVCAADDPKAQTRRLVELIEASGRGSPA
jgi:thiamine-phosphate pyrophosphorylase